MDTSHPMNKGMDMDMPMDVPMTNAFSLNLPMSRNGSGTSWLPDDAPMYAYMLHSKKWMYMVHGNIFLRYNHQDLGKAGTRGGEKWDAPNMLMFMGQTKVGSKGLFHFNTMFSLDAAIAGGSGYPLLFQTGESWKGKPLVDRQHPHDLFSELSVSYSYSFSPKSDFFVYFGYPGEPALGPVTYVHRPSGMDNPDAPLGHHWTDATHITFGVATIGFRYGLFKLEASSFTGQEPDEDRYNFDKPLFNSWSSRLSLNPTKNWALQISHGYIKSPEALKPDENIHRTTASAMYSCAFREEHFFNATAVWGLNKQKDLDGSNDAQLEASLRLKSFLAYFRYEWVQKSVEELNLEPNTYGNNVQFPVNATTIGAGYDLIHSGNVRVMGGGQLSWYHPDKQLSSLYGKNPLAGEVYLRFYPSLMKMHKMKMENM
ncbi:MAG TPA: hypothetical protein VHE34_16490 [Puia sp.]|uniref:hypothetical protein n=1 Tax=Puia sp. TaxID=2045100 RepID=UPI002CED5D0C|nr:hypothetical protein [Puia sp.]HVU96830.1 hypothetical protein [Puia sp.]